MKVSTGTYSDITSNSATVGGQIIDLGEGVTQYGHYYGKTQGVKSAGTKTTNGVPKGNVSFTSELKNLEPGITYHYQAYLNNGKEIVYGSELSFSTVSLTPPTVTTTAATSVTNTTATLNGTVNANGLSTIVTFEYGLTISYGSTANATPSPVTGNTSTNVSASLTGLSEGTLYHYRVNAVSSDGTVNGEDLTFTTISHSIDPVFVSSTIQNATPGVLEMTYNLTLANIVPAASAFTVMVNSVARTVNTVAISGTKVTLTLASAVVYGDIVTVAYTKPVSNPLQTASGGQAATISAQTVTNNVLPLIPGYVSSAIQNATPGVLEMTYNLTLANIVPAASAFTVMVNSVARTVSAVAISGTKVTLTLASAVVYGDIVTVAYTKPASNPLQTASGGQAATISAQTVTNNILPLIPGYVSSAIQNATPGVLEMTYNLTLANIVPAASAFTVMVNSVARTVNAVAISGTKVTLTLASAVVYGDIVTVAYTKPVSNPLQTASGGQAATISAQTVTNNVLPLIPGYVSSAVQNATPGVLEMTYNLTLANIVPAASAFTVMVNSVARTVSTVAISGTKVTLTLASAVVYGDIVTVAYTKPASNPLQTASGGQAATISVQTVTNNTLCSVPSAITNAPTSLTNTTVTLNGMVNANGCSSTVAFDYGLTVSYGSTVTAVQSPVSGTSLTSVSAGITGLTSGQTYHYRLKAANAGSPAYGADMVFTTTVNDKDGNVYNTVTIGTQVWMKENLKTTRYSNGDLIGTTNPSTLDITSEVSPKYQWAAGNNESNVATYGRFYTWFVATDSRNVCPSGWHVPSDTEWERLKIYLGATLVAGGKIKETGTLHWQTPNTGATNETGFTAVPAGYRFIDGSFVSLTVTCYFWSTSPDPAISEYGLGQGLHYNDNILLRGGHEKINGMTIRCLKN